MSWLETELDRAAATQPNAGRPGAFHRLNRTEYQNAIRDLLALDIDVSALLPGDTPTYGFDNNADVLSMSPSLFDGYLSTAGKIAGLATGDLSMGPDLSIYKFSALFLQQGRTSDDLPLGAAGGEAVRHYFPLDGEYVIDVDLEGEPARNERVELRLDGVRVGTIGSAAAAPPVAPTDDAPPARPSRRIRFSATAGSHVVAVVFVKGLLAPEGQFPAYFPWGNSARSPGARTYLHVGGFEISGPFSPTGVGDTPSRQRVFVCRPASPKDDEACATRILSTLVRRAYRRPLVRTDLDALLGFYRKARAQGAGFDTGIKAGLERLLADPDFIYRIETDPPGVRPGSAYRLTDLELASRLSFFLWSSIPDDELLELAERGRLKDPVVLEHQVRRMLSDGRATALVTSFGAQWLYQRNLRMIEPDSYQFPDWDENLRLSMARETEMFLESQLRSDRGVDELLTADYTFVNDRLARHYGLPGVYGSHFRRVTLPPGQRAGLFGQASILTVTSMPNRTSPVVRGKWLLENILGTPMPAPPPDIPPFPEVARNAPQPRTVRARMEEHRKNPVCASCHAVMDPIGFSLEQFDAIGRWRETDGGEPVDSTGATIDGQTIDGPRGLRELLVSRRGQFVQTFTEKLLIYALGRGVEYYDMPVVRQIVRDAAETDYRWSSIILGITKSRPFQMRTARSEP